MFHGGTESTSMVRCQVALSKDFFFLLESTYLGRCQAAFSKDFSFFVVGEYVVLIGMVISCEFY